MLAALAWKDAAAAIKTAPNATPAARIRPPDALTLTPTSLTVPRPAGTLSATNPPQLTTRSSVRGSSSTIFAEPHLKPEHRPLFTSNIARSFILQWGGIHLYLPRELG